MKNQDGRKIKMMLLNKVHRKCVERRMIEREKVFQKSREARELMIQAEKAKKKKKEKSKLPQLIEEEENKVQEEKRRLFCNNSLPELQVKCDMYGYRIFEKILGIGGNGTVFLAKHINTGRHVAVKQCNQNHEEEVLLMKSINSPYVIKLYDYWTITNNSQTKYYFAMEKGENNLQDCFHLYGLQERLEFFDDIVKGMQVLVENNILHLDLKLNNILIKNGKAKITDFGLSQEISNEYHRSRYRLGTELMMAPQASILKDNHYQYSRKCDIWALGIMLYMLMYNQYPFEYDHNNKIPGKRIYNQKKYGYYDFFIDQCLKENEKQRMSWSKFKQFYVFLRKQHHSVQMTQRINRISLKDALIKNQEKMLNPKKKRRLPKIDEQEQDREKSQSFQEIKSAQEHQQILSPRDFWIFKPRKKEKEIIKVQQPIERKCPFNIESRQEALKLYENAINLNVLLLTGCAIAYMFL